GVESGGRFGLGWRGGERARDAGTRAARGGEGGPGSAGSARAGTAGAGRASAGATSAGTASAGTASTAGAASSLLQAVKANTTATIANSIFNDCILISSRKNDQHSLPQLQPEHDKTKKFPKGFHRKIFIPGKLCSTTGHRPLRPGHQHTIQPVCIHG